MASLAAAGIPVFIGSGASWENISTLMQAADGVIVSSSLKRNGRIDNPIDPIRVSQFVEAARRSLSQKQQHSEANGSGGLMPELGKVKSKI
jgi:predicted TIM-barrel enzyme